MGKNATTFITATIGFFSVMSSKLVTNKKIKEFLFY